MEMTSCCVTVSELFQNYLLYIYVTAFISVINQLNAQILVL